MEIENPRGEALVGKPLPFALPGVPLRSDMAEEPAAPAEPAGQAAAEAPVTAPAEPAAAEAAPAPDAAAPKGDLEFHLEAAGRYSARKKYRSAAAEYGAAARFLPAGDARAVYVLERQGAMLLKAGAAPKAQEYFVSAIGKAKELNAAGGDLANAHLGLGYCLEKANKVPDAIASYERAMELTSSKTVKARLAKTISELKKTP